MINQNSARPRILSLRHRTFSEGSAMLNSRIVAAALIASAVAGCNKPATPAAQVRPVRTVTVERMAEGETVSLTGQIRAKDEVSLAFRIDGRVV